MLKVAVVTHYFPTSAKPWEGHSAYQTLRKLALLCDIHVFCSVVQYPSLLHPKKDAEPVDLNWAPPEVKVTYIPYTAIPVLSRPLNGFIIGQRVLPYVRAFQPDIIFSYMIYPQGLAAVRIARALAIPSVLTAIGSDLNRISDPLCGVLTRYALREADFISTVSHDLCRTARSMGADPARSRAKKNGCDTSVFHPRERSEVRRALNLDLDQEAIVYVGRLDLRKGLSELVEAVALLRASHPKIHCYIIGSGPDKATLEASVARLGIAGAITFVKSCLSARVALWMAAADVVTLPSYSEGCPNVVIEALSSGRPVVATAVGGIPELMDESSGRLVPARDVPALAKALGEVLGRQWDSDTLSHRHSRSWSDAAQDILDIFTEVLNHTPAGEEIAAPTQGAN